MPRTASTGRNHASRRPIPGRQAISSTPVLFRLPEIALLPLQPDAAPDPEDAGELPSHETTDAPVSQPNNEELKAAPLPPPRMEPPAQVSEPDAEVGLSPAEDEDRSWWEHWSSGVVLILLIIALVTAGIIALNDNSEQDPSLLAAADASESSLLDKIEIPDLPVEAESGTGTNTSTVSTSPSTGRDAQDAVSLGNQLELSDSVSLTSEAQNSEAQTSESPGYESTSEFTDPGDNATQSVADGTGSESTLVPADIGSLIPADLPDAGFAQGDASDKAPPSYSGEPSGLTLDGFQDEVVETETAGTQPSLDLPYRMQSPGLFQPGEEAVQSGQQETTPSSPVGTGLPSYEQVLGLRPGQSKYPTVGSGNDSSAPFSTASHQQPAGNQSVPSQPTATNQGTVTGQTTAQAPAQPIRTATPEMDIETLMQKYQFFRAQTDEASLENRYPGGTPSAGLGR